MDLVRRGELRWADLGEPVGSAPGYRRPVIVMSTDRFNRSRIATVVVVAVTSNARLGQAPGNVTLTAGTAGVDRDCVVNVSQLLTLDRRILGLAVGQLSPLHLYAVDRGLRLVLELPRS